MPPPTASTATTPFLLFVLVVLHPHFSHGVATNAATPIKTLVILVMENRSFDHMLGYLKTLNPKINGISPDNPPSNRLSTTGTTNSPSQSIQFSDSSAYIVEPDPGHSFQAIREQIFGSENTSAELPPMNGFAQQAYSVNGSLEMARHVMSGYRPDMVAVYKTLAQEFAVFDRWFASVPSSTQPNRMFVHSATSSGATSNIPAKLAAGYPQRTIFENLQDEGKSFKIYYQDIPATLVLRNLRKLKFVPHFVRYGPTFKNDAARGNLPNYAVIEQHYTDTKSEPATDDHPSHDVYRGQMFVKEVYEALRSSPQWNETLLVITYDEHGGFYDHVPTPVRGVPSPDGIVGPDPFRFRFDRLGVRVPTIMVSPWIDKGTVVSKPKGPTPTSEYEHSSIPATTKKIFNLSRPFLTKRDAWAGTFESVVQQRTEPRTDCPVELPTPVRVRPGEANEEAPLSEFQQELLELAAVLKGENIFKTSLEKILKKMNVKQGKEYMADAVRRFLQAGRLAKKMGVDAEQIVKMRPSLTSRSPSKNNN